MALRVGITAAYRQYGAVALSHTARALKQAGRCWYCGLAFTEPRSVTVTGSVLRRAPVRRFQCTVKLAPRELAECSRGRAGSWSPRALLAFSSTPMLLPPGAALEKRHSSVNPPQSEGGASSHTTETSPFRRLLTTIIGLLGAAWRSLRVLARFIRHAIVFTPLLAASPMLLFQRTTDVWWSLFLFCVKHSGPAAIKFVQWASTRPDIFSSEICDKLSQLHTGNVHHSYRETLRTLTASFGQDWKDQLQIEPQAIGAGCIAQVYRGTLHRGKEVMDVAVKVVHPSVKAEIRDDIAIMRSVTYLLELIPTLRWTSLCDSVEEFSKLMNMQLDLTVEAHNLSRFNQNFEDNPHVIFPQPVEGWISADVLVESFEEGVPINKAFRSQRDLRQYLAKLGVNTFFKMMFHDNLVHGDLHPGNMRVRGIDQNGRRTGGPLALVLLDVGIVTELERQDRVNFIDLFSAIVRRDGHEAGRLMLQRARLHDCPDPVQFEEDVAHLVERVTRGGTRLDLASVKVGELLSQVLNLTCKHRVKIESNFTSIVIAIMVLEGVGRSLDPELDLLRLAGPMLLGEKAKMKMGFH